LTGGGRRSGAEGESVDNGRGLKPEALFALSGLGRRPGRSMKESGARLRSVFGRRGHAAPVTPQDVLHAVLQLELPLLQVRFFELFRLGEVMLLGEFVESIFELAMLGGELVELLVGLQQQFFQVLRLLIHAPPPVAILDFGFGFGTTVGVWEGMRQPL
jgi:hypothetical protein